MIISTFDNSGLQLRRLLDLEMTKSVKVAAVQAAPVSFDLEKSLEKVAHFTAEAANAGANLVVFP